MDDKLILFEQKAELQLKNMASILWQKKEIEKAEKKLKEVLQSLMAEYGVTNIETPVLKIVSVAGSESKTVDLEEFKKYEPEEYAQLLADYPKTTTRKAYVRFELPKEKTE